MPVFKLYYKLLRENILSLILYIVIFFSLCVLLASAGKKNDMAVYQETRLKVTVVDRDHSSLSQSILTHVGKNHDLVEIKDEREELIDAMYYRKMEYILTIPGGFEKAFLAGEEASLENIKVPDSYSGFLLDTQINEYVQNCKLYMLSGLSLEEAVEEAMRVSEIETEVSYLEGKKIEEEKPGIYYYFRFVPYVLITIMMSGFGLVFLAILQPDHYKRMTCSSLSLKKYNLELSLASVLFAIGLWGLLLLFGVIIYQKSLFIPQLSYCIMNSICMTLVSMSIGCYVGLISKNENMVSGLSTIVSLGMAFLGGVFASVELISDKVLILSKLLPTYWYTQNNEMFFQGVMMTQSQKQEVYQGFGIQLLFAVVVFIAGLLVSKKHRESIK